MKKNLFTNPYPSVSSDRILYTPSNFARSSLFYLQETGTLQALQPHTSVRERLDSCLFFLAQTGLLEYSKKSTENPWEFMDDFAL